MCRSKQLPASYLGRENVQCNLRTYVVLRVDLDNPFLVNNRYWIWIIAGNKLIHTKQQLPTSSWADRRVWSVWHPRRILFNTKKPMIKVDKKMVIQKGIREMWWSSICAWPAAEPGAPLSVCSSTTYWSNIHGSLRSARCFCIVLSWNENTLCCDVWPVHIGLHNCTTTIENQY